MVEYTRRRSRQLGFARAREPRLGLHPERKITVICKGRENEAQAPPNEIREKHKVLSGWAGPGECRPGCASVGMAQCCLPAACGDFVEPARHGTGPSTGSGRTVPSGHRWGGLYWRAWPAAFLREKIRCFITPRKNSFEFNWLRGVKCTEVVRKIDLQPAFY